MPLVYKARPLEDRPGVKVSPGFRAIIAVGGQAEEISDASPIYMMAVQADTDGRGVIES